MPQKLCEYSILNDNSLVLYTKGIIFAPLCSGKWQSEARASRKFRISFIVQFILAAAAKRQREAAAQSAPSLTPLAYHVLCSLLLSSSLPFCCTALLFVVERIASRNNALSRFLLQSGAKIVHTRNANSVCGRINPS